MGLLKYSMAKEGVDHESVHENRCCEVGVQITNQLNKVGVNSIVIKGKSDQLMGNGSISIV